MDFSSTLLISLGSIFISSFLVALSGALMPGPMLTVTLSESVHRGGKTGPLMILGHGILELLLIIALVNGLAPFMTAPSVFISVSVIGGAILLWMGFSMFRSLPFIQLTTTAEGSKRNNLVFTGVLLSIANPYWLIWWATIGIGYILQTLHFGIIGLAAFFCGHILADLAWYSLVSYGMSKGKQFITDTHYRWLIGCCASFLLLFSAWFFYSGIHAFLQPVAQNS